MKLKPIGIFILVLLALPASLSAQHRYWLELRCGYDALLEGGQFQSWDNGWHVGGGAAYQAMPGMQLAAHAVYHRYPYEKYTGAVPCVLGLVVTGEAIDAGEASLALRLHETDRRAGLFFTTRAGLCYYRFGRIFFSYSGDAQPLEGTGLHVVKPFGSVGLGFRIPFSPSVKALLESGFTFTFDGEQRFFPVMATVQYGL